MTKGEIEALIAEAEAAHAEYPDLHLGLYRRLADALATRPTLIDAVNDAEQSMEIWCDAGWAGKIEVDGRSVARKAFGVFKGLREAIGLPAYERGKYTDAETLLRLEALTATRPGVGESSNSADVAVERISLDDSFASPSPAEIERRLRLPDPALLRAMWEAQMPNEEPVSDYITAPPNADHDEWEMLCPGITKGKFFHSSYAWSDWYYALTTLMARALADAIFGAGGPSPSTANVEAGHDIPAQTEHPPMMLDNLPETQVFFKNYSPPPPRTGGEG